MAAGEGFEPSQTESEDDGQSAETFAVAIVFGGADSLLTANGRGVNGTRRGRAGMKILRASCGVESIAQGFYFLAG